MKKIITILSLLVLIFIIDACSYDDLNKTNPNVLVVDTYYKNADELNKGLNAIYGAMTSTNLFSRYYWFLNDMRSDENGSGGGQLGTEFNQVLLGTHNPSNPVVGSVWNGLYITIHRANSIITNAPEAADADEATKNRAVAEALAARGWAYYELGTLWGNAPIYLSFATSPDNSAPLSSQDEVLAQAIEDLQAAANGLTFQPREPGTLTKGAALALLGRVYMFQGDYTNAKTAFDQIVASGSYSLVDEYDDNFQEENEYNSESIWEIGYAKIGNFNWDPVGNGLSNEASIHSQEYSGYGWRNVIPSQAMLDEFETPENGAAKRDPRLDKSFYFEGDTFGDPEDPRIVEGDEVNGNSLLYQGAPNKISWRKPSIMYKLDPGGYYETGLNHRVIRYAEVLLNLAECEIEVGSISQAVNYMNMVRQRPSVNMPPYPTAQYPVGSKQQAFEALMHEKMVELGGEQIRNRDLLRWRAQGKLTVDPITYYTPKHQLLPIPLSEIDNNANIEDSDQNPGY
ncbi:RagB/SusD family nutrient uptake outer membrane protein [Galbibacter mesophilus]|uniref:RagB/SusD family nutrient uptake outer membrane protein n=1 Tax=Galbibacter mesophilus TaxID=379069 RepID=UPI00191F78CC|nr:RagB/SusD family nutrient uptake outer membrane protein [Galbibacter mesophilus]MCM5663695.1 RagB/SusD family nutrient uptake outer membrane protein [Galbibacter mesophilus]